MGKEYVTKRQVEAKAELKLLRSVERGTKSFAQSCEDAADFAFAGNIVGGLATSNAASGIKKRIGEITGVTTSTLDYFPIRFKGYDSTPRVDPGSCLTLKQQTFITLRHLEQDM